MSFVVHAPLHILRTRHVWRAWQLPVLVSDLDLECKLWLKIRLAPMCPYFGTISLAFVGAPIIKVQLLPYNRVRLMRIPILQVNAFLATWVKRKGFDFNIISDYLCHVVLEILYTTQGWVESLCIHPCRRLHSTQ